MCFILSFSYDFLNFFVFIFVFFCNFSVCFLIIFWFSFFAGVAEGSEFLKQC